MLARDREIRSWEAMAVLLQYSNYPLKRLVKALWQTCKTCPDDVAFDVLLLNSANVNQVNPAFGYQFDSDRNMNSSQKSRRPLMSSKP
jgi:hypothetical protein